MSRLIIPGWHGSGAGHWQRCWPEVDPDSRLVEQEDWERPDLRRWLDRLDAAVRRSPRSTLIAHSLGAVLVAHYARLHPGAPVRAALLVAPADVEALGAGHALAAFGPLPQEPLPFPSLLAYSLDDPYLAVPRAKWLARRWGSEAVDLGRAGHVNIESGHGRWPQGFALAARLSTGAAERHAA